MKLLELMLKEEIEWPVGVGFAAQDGDDRTVHFYFESPVKSEFGQRYWVTPGVAAHSKIRINTLSDDWSTRIITREEYQAAGGWMKWEGGARNFVNTSKVCVKFRGEAPCDTTGIAYEYLWTHSGLDSDVMAYRIINQRPVQLDNPEIEPDFEPFVSVEDAQECKAEHAATSKQSAPKGSGNPILGMVLADLTNRALEGKEKYGEPLKAHNGRNALWDAYQEALDLAMYLRQLIQEQHDA